MGYKLTKAGTYCYGKYPDIKVFQKGTEISDKDFKGVPKEDKDLFEKIEEGENVEQSAKDESTGTITTEGK